MPRQTLTRTRRRLLFLIGIGLFLALAGAFLRPSPVSVLQAAQEAFHRGEYQQAAELYGQAVSLCGDPGHAVFNRAVALYQINQDDQASAEFASVRQDAPQDRQARACYNRGNCLLRLACSTSGEKRQELLQDSIQQYEACLRMLGDNPTPLGDDAHHNLALARKLLSNQREKQETAKEQRHQEHDAEQDRQVASSATQSTQQQESDGSQEVSRKEKQSNDNPQVESQEKQTCPVCGAECKKCDKECSSCKSCLGKQGNSASPSGSGTQPSPGDGNGAGKEGGQQPMPSGAQGNQGRTGKSSGSDGEKPSPRSSEKPGGVPGDSDGRPRPGPVATRNRPDESGGESETGSPKPTASALGNGGKDSHSAASQGGSQPGNIAASSTPVSLSGAGSVMAPSASRDLVEVFFQPDPQQKVESLTTNTSLGRGQLIQRQQEAAPSPAATQAEKVLRSAVQRIEQGRKQRPKLGDVWQDHPAHRPDLKDW
ncbi:MAG: hypothetical protein NZM31_03020 [Gemmatales bacterium]|nr:hypothetical protein [Gemmatales bacterium]MDW8385972.1 hypothetical protein [Gemmatales bacterium]